MPYNQGLYHVGVGIESKGWDCSLITKSAIFHFSKFLRYLSIFINDFIKQKYFSSFAIRSPISCQGMKNYHH